MLWHSSVLIPPLCALQTQVRFSHAAGNLFRGFCDVDDGQPTLPTTTSRATTTTTLTTTTSAMDVISSGAASSYLCKSIVAISVKKKEKKALPILNKKKHRKHGILVMRQVRGRLINCGAMLLMQRCEMRWNGDFI